MAQFKAQLETEISIQRAVADLAQHSGDNENDVMLRIAGLLEELELSGHAVRFYVKAPSHINPGRRRTLEIQSAVVSTRLRQAARDGWPSVRKVRRGGDSIPFADVAVDKGNIIAALEAKQLPVPKNWTGQSDEAAQPLTRAAVKQRFPQLTPGQWEKLFEHESKNGLVQHRLASNQGKHALYDSRGIERWLAARPTAVERGARPSSWPATPGARLVRVRTRR